MEEDALLEDEPHGTASDRRGGIEKAKGRRLSSILAGLSSSASYTGLPARVRRRIRRQQARSEVLIGWIQLAVVIAWAVLYTLAPKTFGEDATFAPVPWALSAYFVFTLVRLLLATRRPLPEFLLYLSVVVDMLLLLVLIWSYHLQYEQPPSFYLKAPTLLYVFIFIALRALRFEVRFVLLAGTVAAVGWLAMVWYAMNAASIHPMITRDYVEYMTSNSILLGAEFDKVISILMVTGILAVAIARARHLLIQSVVEGSTARDLSRFVPSEVAQRIATAEDDVELGEGEEREATILFTDIENFTAISEQVSPRDLIKALNEYFTAIAKPIEANGGVITQFQGDAILASFNIPAADPRHATHAVRAACEIQKIVKKHRFGGANIELRTRIGLNTGMVVGGLVGSDDRLGYTVHSDEVNLAARLEQLNKEHGTRILLSKRTCELAGRERFPFQEIGSVTVRGHHTPVVVYTIDADKVDTAGSAQFSTTTSLRSGYATRP